MSAFSQKGLEALNQAWTDNESAKYDAERRAGIAESQGDQYALAQAYQDYANADQAQQNLMAAYERAEKQAAQAQTAPKPMSEGEELQRHIWETSVKTGNPQWDTYLTQRWKQGEAFARGADPNHLPTMDHVPGRTTPRRR